MRRCAICGTDLEADLFSAVTREPCCAICTTKHVGGLPQTKERVEGARKRLGLADGEYLKQDRGEEARKILGR